MTENEKKRPTKKELIDMLDKMIESYENLPQHAMMLSITNYDFVSSLMLISALFRSEESSVI